MINRFEDLLVKYPVHMISVAVVLRRIFILVFCALNV